MDVIIEGGAKLFVSAVGVPPKWAVDKLHRAGVLYMVCFDSAFSLRIVLTELQNVVGHPKVVCRAAQSGLSLLDYSMSRKRATLEQTSSVPKAEKLVVTRATFLSGLYPRSHRMKLLTP